jgi:hypothetical protein
MALPPGVTAKNFTEAVRRFEEAVGKAWVFTADADIKLYRDAYSPYWGEKEDRVASAAVAPASTEEVQKVVRIANDFGIPLDLKRMNRILEVDEKNHFALVEPGVSYFDLYRHIHERGLKVWIDCPDPGWGSVTGNALDRGGGYTTGAFRNHFEAHCGLEVVLPTGELLRTGMGALPGSKTWQQYRSGYGPYINGLFSQSNYGVVTKMGIWLMPQPEAYRTGAISFPRQTDVIPLVETLTYLENAGVTNGMPAIASPLLARGRDPEHAGLLARRGGPDPQALEAYGQRNNLPYWTCNLQFYGPAKVIEAQWEHARDRFLAIRGAKAEAGEAFPLPLTPKQLETAHKVAFGIPNLSIFSIGARSETNPNPTDGHIWFSPIIPRTGEAVLEAQQVFGKAFEEWNLPLRGFNSTPTTYWTRAFILLFGFPITHDVAKNTKMRADFKKLVQLAADHGWGEYRTAPTFQDEVMDTYSFNNHALRRFNETIKDAIDPKGILSAGRYGIWPKHLRKGTRT